jgi:AcrR family transcriptional regulator
MDRNPQLGSAPLASGGVGTRLQDETRESVLDVTYRLLEERGYAGVTTDDIAAEARMSKATIYRYWRTKQQLVVDATRSHFGTVDTPDLASFRAEVHWIVEHRMRDYRDPRTLRLVAELVGAAVSDPQLRPLFAEWVAQLSDALETVVERGVARGDVREDVDRTAAVALIAGLVARTVVSQQAFDSEAVVALVELITLAVGRSDG